MFFRLITNYDFVPINNLQLQLIDKGLPIKNRLKAQESLQDEWPLLTLQKQINEIFLSVM